MWKSRSQSLEEESRGTESMLLEVQCEVSTVSDDLGTVGVHTAIESTILRVERFVTFSVFGVYN